VWGFRPKLKEHMQYCVEHPEEVSKLAKVKAQVSEVQQAMRANIDQVCIVLSYWTFFQIIFCQSLCYVLGSWSSSENWCFGGPNWESSRSGTFTSSHKLNKCVFGFLKVVEVFFTYFHLLWPNLFLDLLHVIIMDHNLH